MGYKVQNSNRARVLSGLNPMNSFGRHLSIIDPSLFSSPINVASFFYLTTLASLVTVQEWPRKCVAVSIFAKMTSMSNYVTAIE